MAGTVAALLLVSLPDLGDARAMAARFDPRLLGVAAGLSEMECKQSAEIAACVQRNQATANWRISAGPSPG